MLLDLAVYYPEKESGDAVGNDQVCTLCEEYVAMALDYLGENKTQSEIIELLHQSCSQLHAFESEVLPHKDANHLLHETLAILSSGTRRA